ncbi:hypothetical protein GH714_032631 [Hevea brasiliensis]|uniref:Phosphoribosyl-AMP cyclohydrolase domain-containing protein n=1 Tax=Hevea brasiliensis TaxID=3981 RepID=A0A6A6NDP8_HEVBR|nr:hypothetical protein GH714_032631 [Hevea brasiliensis]
MAVSSLRCIQSLGFSSRGRAFFPVGDCSRANARSMNCRLVFALRRILIEICVSNPRSHINARLCEQDALATTISCRKATFYSRSRSSLWTKGETSKNFINVHDIFLDCDRDSIIYLGKPDGPTCHTGSETCYYTSVNDVLEHKQIEGSRQALTTLYSLESTISQRKAELAVPQHVKPSWTKRLLLDSKFLCSKIREEADELCRTIEENEHGTRTASEMGDVLYHAMVLLALKDVKLEDVLDVLRHRFSQSGIEEKRSRGQQNEA